jgi:hypothetical protein
MTPAPARDRFFMIAPLCPLWLLPSAAEERTTTKSEPGSGLLPFSYATRRPVNVVPFEHPAWRATPLKGLALLAWR